MTLELDNLDAQMVEDACFDAGALAVSYTDSGDDPILEPAPGEFRLWPAPRLQAIFPADTDAALLAAVMAATLTISPSRFAIALLPGRAWEREWLKDFRATRFGRRLWVCPSHESVRQSDAAVVMLDPGLAFGTGTHPTTALCLDWLDAEAPLSGSVIDYGCGSGILALAALRLGALHAWCHDIDPQALTATEGNARTNQLAAQLQIVSDADALPANADLLLANILSTPLCELAPRFASLVRPTGRVVLAGILAVQTEEVIRSYAPWFQVEIFGQREGWTCLAGTRLRA